MTQLWRTPRRGTLRSRLTIALLVALLTALVAAGALAQGKSALIGKLEGPEVVADPTKFPKTFKEAPQLAELVKAGKLPPVAERIGQDPLVIKPLHEVGRYGGTWRGGFTGPADFWNGFRCCSGPDHLMFWDYTPINTPTWTLERNPYSVFVDTAGNQLPYIDRVVLTLAENLEVLNLRAIAGEYDFQQRHLDLGKLPVFIENQAKDGYKVYLDPGDYGGDMIIKFNLNYDADPEIAKWFNTA